MVGAILRKHWQPHRPGAFLLLLGLVLISRVSNYDQQGDPGDHVEQDDEDLPRADEREDGYVEGFVGDMEELAVHPIHPAADADAHER